MIPDLFIRPCIPFARGWRAHAEGNDVCPYEREIDAFEWAHGWDKRKEMVKDGIIRPPEFDPRVCRRGGVA